MVVMELGVRLILTMFLVNKEVLLRKRVVHGTQEERELAREMKIVPTIQQWLKILFSSMVVMVSR